MAKDKEDRQSGPVDTAEPSGGGLIGVAVVALTGLIAGVILWLAFSAEDTMADLRRVSGLDSTAVVLALPPRPDADPAERQPAAGDDSGREGIGDAPAEDRIAAPLPADDPADNPADDQIATLDPDDVAVPPTARAPERLTGDAAWQRFSQPFDRADARPRIALVVTHLGLNDEETARSIDTLPPGVTLAFSAYADGLDQWLSQARDDGHEALLMVPMEPEDYPADDPGPHTLRTVDGPETNLENLDWVLARADGYVGVMDTFGSRFTASSAALRPVLRTVGARGLAFVDTRASPRSAGVQVATALGLPSAAVDLRLNALASADTIDLRLLQLEALARESGRAIATIEAYPQALERLAAWSDTLSAKGLVLAPITAVVQAETGG